MNERIKKVSEKLFGNSLVAAANLVLALYMVVLIHSKIDRLGTLFAGVFLLIGLNSYYIIKKIEEGDQK